MKQYNNFERVSDNVFEIIDEYIIHDVGSVNTIVSRSLSPGYKFNSTSTEYLTEKNKPDVLLYQTSYHVNKSSLFENSDNSHKINQSLIHEENPSCFMMENDLNQPNAKSTRSEYSMKDYEIKKCGSFKESDIREKDFCSENETLNLSIAPKSYELKKDLFRYSKLEEILEWDHSNKKKIRQSYRSSDKKKTDINATLKKRYSPSRISQKLKRNLTCLGGNSRNSRKIKFKKSKKDSIQNNFLKDQKNNQSNFKLNKNKINFDIQQHLEHDLRQFEDKLKIIHDIDESSKNLLIIILKFLYGLDISPQEFKNLDDTSRSAFKNFLLDRFFRKETKSNTLSKRNYEEFTNSSITTNSIIVEPDNSFENLIINNKDLKQGALEFIDLEIFDKKKYFGKRTNNGISMSIKNVSSQDIIDENFTFNKLQSFLRKREILSVINKRIQKGEKNAKRNDEKIKKIFKKGMKSLIHKFKIQFLSEKKCRFSSIEIEYEFYKFYFSDLKIPISHFYDPLKKRFLNPKYKSICNDYLKNFWLSDKFVHDFMELCNGPLILEGLKGYSQKLLNRFCMNKNFLQNIDKAKSKFEWVFFEYEVAILHFMFSFYCLKE